jgi:pseudouridine-5'-phosphate glycosidase
MPPARVALETTLILHGVPRESARRLARDLGATVRAHGAEPAFIAVIDGRPVVGLSDAQLEVLLSAERVAKANTSNLGLLMHQRRHGATTMSTTMELAAGAGISIFATGGLGGVHRGYGSRLDISADLAALARFPVAVVCSGVKSILDVAATREVLETLGIPVVGFGTDRFAEFYLRGRDTLVDARFDDAEDLGAFVRAELARTGRGIVIANPVPAEHEVSPEAMAEWLEEAAKRTQGVGGRDVTPAVLGALHEVSGGATLRANIALVLSNAALAARVALRAT